MSKGWNGNNKRHYRYIKIKTEERCGEDASSVEELVALRANTQRRNESCMHKKSDTGWLIIV